MLIRLLVLATIALPAVISAQQQAPATQPSASACSGTEYRTLDFWVGDWVAEDQTGKRIGVNRITKNEYGNCVITEHFRLDDGTMVGHSVSIFRPALKQWRQNWVDSQGSYFDLVGGPVSGADHSFYFENKRVSETQAHQRMIFQDVKPDSFVWRWQKRAGASEPWTDSWVIQYRKQNPATGS